MTAWAWLVVAALICWIIATYEAGRKRVVWRPVWIPLGLAFVALWMVLEVA